MQLPRYVLSFPKGSGWLLILMFDTHQAVKELTEAGFAEAQAEAVVATVSRSMSENVATKADIAEVKADIAVLKADIASLRVETKADIASLRVETKADIASLRTEMAALEMRIIVKMTGVVLAIVTLGVAFLKLFP